MRQKLIILLFVVLLIQPINSMAKKGHVNKQIKSKKILSPIAGPYSSKKECKEVLKKRIAILKKRNDYTKTKRNCTIKNKVLLKNGPVTAVKLVRITSDDSFESVEYLIICSKAGCFVDPEIHQSQYHPRLYSDEIKLIKVNTKGQYINILLKNSGFETTETDENGEPSEQKEFDIVFYMVCKIDKKGVHVWCSPLFPEKWNFVHEVYSKDSEAGKSTEKRGSFAIKINGENLIISGPKGYIPEKFKSYVGIYQLTP